MVRGIPSRGFGAFLLLALGLSLSSCKIKSGEYQQVASQLSGHFADFCRGSQNMWTQRALGQTQSLADTLEALQATQDANCKGITTTLSAVNNVTQQLQSIANDPAMNSYRQAQEKRIELVLTLDRLNGDPANADLIDLVRNELYETELDVAETKASVSASTDDTERNRLVQGLSQLTNSVAGMSQQGNITACLATAPFLPFQIGATMMAMAGNFVTPILGAALSVAGNMMSSTMNFLNEYPIDSGVIDLKQVQMQEALSCSVETMVNHYCDAEVAHRFVSYALASYQQDTEPDSIWAGMDLLGRRLPALTEWLARVANGIDPNDEFSAKRLNDIWERHHYLRTINNTVKGLITKTKEILRKLEGSDRTKREKAAFKEIISTMFFLSYSGSSGGSSSGGFGPIASFISPVTAVCQISGDPQCQRIVDENGEPSVSYLIDRIDIQGGFTSLESRTKELINEVENIISRELQETINQDPDALVAAATQPSLDNLAPVDVMKKLRDFSLDYADYIREKGVTRANIRNLRLAETTAEIFQSAIDKIEDISVPSVEVVEYLFSEFKLLDGLNVISNRVTELIRWEVEDRIRNGDLPDDLTDDAIAAGKNIAKQLEEHGIYLDRDADEVVNDIRKAQSISQQNLNLALRGFFDETIETALETIRETAEAAGETDPSDPSLRQLAHLCLLVLTGTFEWPSAIDMDLCRGTVLKSVYESSGLELNFDQLASEFYESEAPPSFRQRVCTYPNFLRASRLFRAGRPEENPDETIFSSQQINPFVFLPARIEKDRLKSLLF